ncbi:prolipoprotein diacylglyceryl transferase [Mycobacterium sp. 1081908.1]|uniref:prolipoprotein diacylglyceryl transferase n=1 Tax=Mycobacterium sp. 1081908.1 TaxID=1834066 RepID=UPI0007FE54A7|nr:prolipoprotein diacylglyceryl transferase [Mycobacterium sp. 1081908.1]OBK43746.1 prolipoprotein diacylglyceryl transferase [Mycobacterium sp. 1081908.1]
MTHLLAYIPSPPQGVWHLGPLPIRAYALFIIAGIVAALMIGDRRWEARGGQRGVIYDIALWAVPFGLVGGRLYHLATDWRTYWGPAGAGSMAALRIWDGGLGIWGAVALGGVGAWIGCRRRGIPLPAFGDAIAPGIILAQAIGRLGNYFNQELYGRDTTLPWGLEIFYRRDPSGYVDPHSLDGVSTGQVALVVQPTFLYELIWNLVVFVALIYIDRRFNFGHGRLFALYVAAYCVGRFGVELLRNDTATQIAGIRINVFTSTFVFIGAVVYIILAPKGREDPATLHGTDHGGEDAPKPKPEAKPEPKAEVKAEAEPELEPITGVRVLGAAGVAAVIGAGRATKRLIPRRRSGPVQVADAESADADTVKVEAVEPAAEEPETVEAPEPEVAEAEAAEPETSEPEAETEEPEAEEAETAGAEAGEPEVEEPEAETEEPEGEEPETAEAEVSEVEVEEPEAEAPETEEPETREPEAVEAEEAEPEEPETEGPETPETEAAEAEETEADETEAEETEAEETEEPEVADAEAAVAEAVETESVEPEAADAEAVATEAAEAEVAEPEAEELEPEAEEPEAEEAETEAEEPKAEEPEADSESTGPDEPGAAASEEQQAEPDTAAEETPADDTGSTRRRLSFRLRNRGRG